jgi:pimeloyl-[acyl-carrier protein] methyl ester esterase
VKVELLDSFAENLQLNCQQTLLRFLALQVNSLPDSKEVLKQLKQAVKECDVPTERVLTDGLGILKQTDLRQVLMRLTCSVNIIQGDKDTLVPVEVSQDIKRIKPDCNLSIIKGAGHVPFLSHSSQVIDVIKQCV